MTPEETKRRADWLATFALRQTRDMANRFRASGLATRDDLGRGLGGGMLVGARTFGADHLLVESAFNEIRFLTGPYLTREAA